MSFTRIITKLTLLLCALCASLLFSDEPQSGYFEELGLRFDWQSDSNGLMIIWRDLGDGLPPTETITETELTITATYRGQPVVGGVRAIPFAQSGLTTETLIIFDARNAKYLLLQLDALKPLLTVNNYKQNHIRFAVLTTELIELGTVTNSIELQETLGKLAAYTNGSDGVVENTDTLNVALRLMESSGYLRKSIIVTESLLATIGENEILSTISKAKNIGVAIYPILMPRKITDFGWALEISEKSGGKVLPWLGMKPSNIIASNTFSNIYSGGIISYSSNTHYILPGENEVSILLTFTNKESFSYSFPFIVDNATFITLINPNNWIDWLFNQERKLYGFLFICLFIIIISVAMYLLIRQLYGNVIAELEDLNTGEIYRIKKLPFVIGRAENADLRIDDTNVSRRHAAIKVAHGGGLEIIDLESTNGTTLNSVKIQSARLGINDKVCISRTILCLKSITII